MKSPMHQRPDDEAHELTAEFIKQYSRKSLAGPAKGEAGERAATEIAGS